MDELDAADPWGATTVELFGRLDRVLGDAADDVAIATVVGVDGSAYRPPGAKMLVGGDGTTLGGITAGCLEGPLVDVASDVLEAGEARVVTFDLTDDEGGWGLGLGCEGIVDVLVEPVGEGWREPVAAVQGGEARGLVTVVDGTVSVPVGSRAVVRPAGVGTPKESRASDTSPATGAVEYTTIPTDVLEPVLAETRERAADGTWSQRTVAIDDGDVSLFLDGLEPASRLLLFGGQPDVRPVTRLASEVGLHVTVATARGGQADAANFPRADRVVATHPTDLEEFVDERTHVVLMSHNFLDDRLALETLLETATPYIGLMGPRKRFRQLQDELRDEGVRLSDVDRERIASPVGLDLGGGEPIEIALSIVSEVLAASNGRDGGRLRDREGPIHDRATSSTE